MTIALLGKLIGEVATFSRFQCDRVNIKAIGDG